MSTGPKIPFGPFDHETSVAFERGRVEELNGFLFILEIEGQQHPSASLKRLIETTTARLESVQVNIERMYPTARPN